MKFTKLSLVVALAACTAFAEADIVPVEPAAESALEISANLAITSNYVWRGMTQTSNSPAVQGGIDLGYNGFYLGTWLSNVDFDEESDNSLEVDFYVGYASEIAGIGYDLGYVTYVYPNSDFDTDEIYLGLSKDFSDFSISGKYSYALDDDNINTDYWEIGASAKLPMEFTLAAGYGHYEDVGTNYVVSLAKEFGKFELSVAYTDFLADSISDLEDEDHIVGTISTSF